ncbi:hypothetical protein DEIPH_ctg050orf0036 [Deinococcus phoenicis]|uniref:Cytochrome c domain-containing protein n=1 Tax=Deinococcus phoenicis TaxID=1476583 RepID=A0A016QMG7_9DEIO|nr:cytochrome c [Deinococcus phoenicis]EYB67186.1 hypothetical protein DEIPH_ctg050orf0036 [Deinococcus phoenicis]
MKNTFVVTTTLLLALALGGSYAGYRIATTPEHAESGAKPTTTGGVNQSEGVPSAQSASTGAAGAPGAQGDTTPEQTGGTNAGQNGAVVAPTGAEQGKAGADAGTAGAAGGETGGQTTPSPTAEGSEGTQVGQTGTSNTEKATAGNPEVNDTQAAAVANATSGNTGEGQTKFASSCAGCHGANAEGGIGPSLVAANGPKSWTLEQFGNAVHNGHAPDRELSPVMPRFTKDQVSDADLNNMYAYLKSL